MAKSPKISKQTTSFKESLWDSANKLCGSVESSEYKHIMLSLIFLKFISDRCKLFNKEERLELTEMNCKTDAITYGTMMSHFNKGGKAMIQNH